MALDDLNAINQKLNLIIEESGTDVVEAARQKMADFANTYQETITGLQNGSKTYSQALDDIKNLFKGHDELVRVLQRVIDANERAEKSQVLMTKAQRDAAAQSLAWSRGIYFAAQGIEDLNYGLAATLNNMPLVITAFARATGVAEDAALKWAGWVSIVTSAGLALSRFLPTAEQFYRFMQWDQQILTDAEALEKLTKSTGRQAQAQAALNEQNRIRNEYQEHFNKLTKEQATQSTNVQNAIDEFGEGDLAAGLRRIAAQRGIGVNAGLDSQIEEGKRRLAYLKSAKIDPRTGIATGGTYGTAWEIERQRGMLLAMQARRDREQAAAQEEFVNKTIREARTSRSGLERLIGMTGGDLRTNLRRASGGATETLKQEAERIAKEAAEQAGRDIAESAREKADADRIAKANATADANARARDFKADQDRAAADLKAADMEAERWSDVTGPAIARGRMTQAEADWAKEQGWSANDVQDELALMAARKAAQSEQDRDARGQFKKDEWNKAEQWARSQGASETEAIRAADRLVSLINKNMNAIAAENQVIREFNQRLMQAEERARRQEIEAHQQAMRVRGGTRLQRGGGRR